VRFLHCGQVNAKDAESGMLATSAGDLVLPVAGADVGMPGSRIDCSQVGHVCRVPASRVDTCSWAWQRGQE